MKLRIASDFHLEFFAYRPSNNIGLAPWRETNETIMLPIMDGEAETILILAGDIITAKQFFYLGADPLMRHPMEGFFDALSKRFLKIIIIAGNHEFYGSEYGNTIEKLKVFYSRWSNINFLYNEPLIIDDVLFYGATLWTDFNKDPNAELYARRAMSDFMVIEYGPKPFTPADSVLEHDIAKHLMVKSLKEYSDMKKVVITHHTPSLQNIHPKFKGSLLNAAFHSNMDDFILNYEPDLWISGHTHEGKDYHIGKTRMIINPKGYYKENQTYFPFLVVEI